MKEIGRMNSDLLLTEIQKRPWPRGLNKRKKSPTPNKRKKNNNNNDSNNYEIGLTAGCSRGEAVIN